MSILVVEDDVLIAIDIQSVLESAGHRVIGPANSLSGALELISREVPDVALLDIGIGGSRVFGLADELAGLKSRVIFLSGYSRDVIPDSHRHRRLIPKPFLPSALLQALDEES